MLRFPSLSIHRIWADDDGFTNPANLATSTLALEADEANVSIRTAASFDDANSEFLSSADSAFNFGDNDFSIGGWIRTDDITDTQSLFTKWGAAGTLSFRIQMNGNTGVLRSWLSSDGTASTQFDTVGVLTANTWYFVVLVYDATADLMKVSINAGTFETASHSGGAYNGSSEDFKLGHFTGSSSYMSGRQDSVLVYNKALSQSEVSTLYAGGLGQNYFDMDKVLLLEFWSLNETSGTRYGSHSGLHLEDNATVTYADGKVLDRGIDNNVFASSQFTAANDEYLSSSDSVFDFQNIDFSWSCWFRLDSLGVPHEFVNKGGTTGIRGHILNVNTSNELQWQVSGDGTALTIVKPISTLVADRWYHVVAYHDSVNDEIGVSLDGATFVTAAHSTGVNSTSASLKLGLRVAASTRLNGRMDSISVYQKALSQSEVTTLYAGGAGQNYNDIDKVSLLEYWSLNEASGTRFGIHGGYHLEDNATVTGADGKVEHLWTDNYIAKAAQFTAANSEYLSSSNAVFDFSTSYTAYGWFKCNGTSMAVMSKYGASGNRAFTSALNLGGNATFSLYNTSNVVHHATSTLTISDTTWYFFVGIYNAATGKVGISINNETIVWTTFVGSLKTSTAPFNIGQQGSFYSDGFSDGSGFYNKAVSQSEVTTLYNSGKGVRFEDQDTVSLLAHWKLDEASGTRLDSHTGGYDLTDNATVTQADGKVTDLLADQGKTYPISYINDLSGEGNHFEQAAISLRMVYYRDTNEIDDDGTQWMECINGATPFASDTKGEVSIVSSRTLQATISGIGLSIGDIGVNDQRVDYLMSHEAAGSNPDAIRLFINKGGPINSIGKTIADLDGIMVLQGYRSNNTVYNISRNAVDLVKTVIGSDNGDWIDHITTPNQAYIGKSAISTSVIQQGRWKALYYNNDEYSASQRPRVYAYINDKFTIY